MALMQGLKNLKLGLELNSFEKDFEGWVNEKISIYDGKKILTRIKVSYLNNFEINEIVSNISKLLTGKSKNYHGKFIDPNFELKIIRTGNNTFVAEVLIIRSSDLESSKSESTNPSNIYTIETNSNYLSKFVVKLDLELNNLKRLPASQKYK